MLKQYLTLIILFFRITKSNSFIRSNQTAMYATNVPFQRQIFDQDLYEISLDPELCNKQLSILLYNPIMAFPFLDAGFSKPRGILEGNLADLGNYHQCLAINQNFQDVTIEGKYCSISIPVSQTIKLAEFVPSLNGLKIVPKLQHEFELFQRIKNEVSILTQGDNSRVQSLPMSSTMMFDVAICIPKPCTTHQAIEPILRNLDFTENYCRLPNDKPIAPADYVAISIFSVIGLLIIISSCYDMLYVFVFKKDVKEKSAFYTSFSLYTNTIRMLTFKPSADSLDCLDGIRAISILWIIVGHTHSVVINRPIQNPVVVLEWVQSLNSLWIIAAHLSVDTFFMLSGLLCAYAVAKKTTTRWNFLKNVPMFYLQRYLRMFPLLAAAVLLQASLAHHVGDGPIWTNVATNVNNCRQSWWIVLIHLQNYISGPNCISPTWHLSVDMQLYLISPMVLVWLCAPRHGNGRLNGWLAVTVAVLTSLITATLFCFLNDFPSHPLTQPSETSRYMRRYYTNTLTRAPPFFIGIMVGYVLHLKKDTKIQLPEVLIAILWAVAAVFSSFAIFIHYPTIQTDYDNQFLDNVINSYQRSMWVAAVGWMVIACVHGYGGPINWFLSLRLWKLPARLSYAMYLLHMGAMIVINDMQLSSFYFTQWSLIYRFFADLVLSLILAVILTLSVDLPISTLLKIILTGRGKNQEQQFIVKKDDDMTENF